MECVLKFLRFSSGPTAQADLRVIDRAIEKSQNDGIDVVVIREPDRIQDILSRDTDSNDGAIYVCYPFEGKIFSLLQEKHYRIVGPQCILSCLLLERPLPHVEHPVCNVAMLDVTISCSSIKRDERKIIHDLVLKMGGEVSTAFTTKVTHLIANEVGSNKYQVASKSGLSIVLPEWVHRVWRDSQHNHVLATAVDVVDAHRTPTFKGCTISVTGIQSAERLHIKEMVESNGGRYSGELEMKTCTHLITKYPTGEKYNFARQWKLWCVLPIWLDDCVKAGHWLVEGPYVVEPDADTTQRNASFMQNKSSVNSTCRESMFSADISRTSIASKAADNAAKSFTRHKSQDEATMKEAENYKIKISLFDTRKLSVDESILQNVDSSFLDGCKIYLGTMSDEVLNYCRKIINSGGGIRFSKLNESTTHFIIGDEVSMELRKYLNGLENIPPVISPLWLIESCKEGRCLPEKEYSLVQLREDLVSKPVVKQTSMSRPSEEFVRPVDPPSRIEPIVAKSININFEDEEENFFDQYITGGAVNHESTRLSQMDENSIHAGRDGDLTQNNRTILEMQNNCPEANDTNATREHGGDNDDTTGISEMDTTAGLPQVFPGRTFFVKRFDDEMTSKIAETIPLCGGIMSSSDKNSQFVIVPLHHEQKKKIDKREVTLAWFEMCVEEGEFLDPDTSRMFRPFHIARSVRPLDGCVITVSQFVGKERDNLLMLAELLGGIGQEIFSRKDGAEHRGNTHLVLRSPEGAKYNASIKWGVACVTQDWLTQCATSGTRMPERDFPVLDEKDDTTITLQEEEDTTATAITKATENLNEQPEPSRNVSENITSASFGIKDIPSVDWNDFSTVNFGKPDDTSVITKDKNEGKELCANDNAAAVTLVNKPLPNDFSEFNKEISRGDLGVKTDTLVLDAVANGTGNGTTSSSAVTPRMFVGKNRYSFDLDDALAMLQSPGTPSSSSEKRRASRLSRGAGGSRVSLPFEVQFGEALQKAVDNIPENLLVRLEAEQDNNGDDEVFNKEKEQLEKQPRRRSSINLKFSCDPPIDATSGLDNASTTARQGELPSLEEGKSPLLAGVVMVVGKKLAERQSELHNAATEMGAECRFAVDDGCTHLIHQGKMTELSKDIVAAKRDGRFLVVSPHWLEACLRLCSRVDEKLYPPTYNPRMSLQVSSAEPKKPTEPTPFTTRDSIHPSDMKSPVSIADNLISSPPARATPTSSVASETVDRELVTSPTSEERMLLQMKMQKIMEETKASRNSTKRNRRQTTNNSSSNSDGTRKLKSRSSSFQRSIDSSGDVADLPACDVVNDKPITMDRITEPSQSCDVITYEDPEGRLERERIMAQLGAASPSQRFQMAFEQPTRLIRIPNEQNKDAAVEEKERESTPNENVDPNSARQSPIIDGPAKPIRVEYETPRDPQSYRFLLSGLSPQEKIDYAAIVEDLGGQVIDAQFFNGQCTHVVAGSATRNEKFLASIAAGKWLLHKSYLEASREAGHFARESEHEWGTGPDPVPLALAARRWRVELETRRRADVTAGTFSGWVVLMCVEKSKQPGLKRLLEAGGARVVAVRPPFNNIEGCTHTFVSNGKMADDAAVDLSLLHNANILILKPDFIADYLIVQPTPPPHNYVLPEARCLGGQEEEVADAATPRKRKCSTVQDTTDATNNRTKRTKR